VSSFGLIPLEAIFAMLADCAPGVIVKEHLHHLCVEWRGRFHPSLPLGARTSRRKTVLVGKVRNLVRALDLPIECVNRHFPGLIKATDV
jgi:hypothetical protein